MQPSSPSPLVERVRLAGSALELTPAHIIGLLVLASCGCAGLVALWWTARPEPAVHIAPLVGATPSASEQSAAPQPPVVVVHVSGAVASEGVQELAMGSRVVDAIDAAGGPRRTARTDQLNLARTLQDGEQIHLPDATELRSAPGTAGGDGTPGAAAHAGGDRVNLNRASDDELEALPGVGPVLASRIIAHRESAGGFSAVEDLLQIDGIGEKTFAQLRDHVTV